MPSVSAGVLACRAVLLSAAMTFLVLAADSAATPRQSALDQYEQQPSPPLRSDHPKLHRVHLAHTGYHRFSLLPNANKVPELQVGCAEGSLHERHADSRQDVPFEVFKNTMTFRNKRQAEPQLQGSRVLWFNIAPQQSAGSTVVQSYQLRSSVPYYIPVWGNPSRIPVFFPPKPILYNPGYPTKNRPRPTGALNNTVTIDSRIRDDRPSWGIVEPTTTTRRPAAAPGGLTKPPTPPLLHRPSVSDDDKSDLPEEMIIAQNIEMVFATTPRPPQATAPSTAAPPASNQAGSNDRELNRCVWAIISCCNPTSPQVKLSCFEGLGCSGAFWDRSPCSREVTVAALQAAQKFYDQS